DRRPHRPDRRDGPRRHRSERPRHLGPFALGGRPDRWHRDGDRSSERHRDPNAGPRERLARLRRGGGRGHLDHRLPR
ncbi:MAG TPA: hypothetical protein VEN82_06845, partial [Actinomycetota bacterium]|nr:hypothetical protein [Actinomycetota bacterium]